MAKKRTDAERRIRQCEGLSRLLRILRLIMGAGRWDARAIAGELECSQRTVFRDLQTLSMAGVPWYFDKDAQAYRVPAGFKFPSLDTSSGEGGSSRHPDPITILAAARQLLADGERFVESLRGFCETLKGTAAQG